jgi:carboxyl-terminal processing protease
MRRHVKVVLVGCALWVGLASPVSAQLTNCSAVSQTLFVRDVMEDIYYWNTQMPRVNAATFRSPEEYLEAVRYQPLDSSFSYIGSRAASDAYYSESQFIGFGLGFRYEDEALRISQVFPESPAAEAGLQRSDRIVALNGIAVATLAATGMLDATLGPAQIGYGVDVRIQSGNDLRDARIVKREVTIPTVSYLNLYEVNGRIVAYMFFRNFVTPSIDALNDAFGALRDVGAQELILDLRYNGGGLVSVARHLASLIGGKVTEGQVLAEYFHNDRNAFRNQIVRFEEKERAMAIDKVVVITSRSSASASELLVNALQPFMKVTTVGTPTFGKPVGQYGINFCDKVLYPVSFTLRNALGQGDYFGGIPADCPAEDDLNRQLTDPDEASLKEALHVMATGTCSTPPPADDTTVPRRRLSVQDTWPPLTGLRGVIGAY